MPSGYQPLPTSRPTTPQRSRSFNRASPPDSLTLSPASVYSYSETDAFLSPRLGPGTPGSSPSSPYNFFHPPSSPHQTLLLSPLVENSLEKTQKGYFELKLPPTAKRTRKSKVWLGVGAGVAVVLVCVGAMSVLGGVVDRSQLEDYSNRVIEKATRLKEAVSEKWIDASVVAETEKENFEDVELPPSPPIETYEPEVLEVAIKAKDETGLIPISLLPRPRQSSVKTEETRYIGFLPHSGVHNQRIALQNALLLGKLLGRTVLVPPIWIGWPISTEPYNDLVSAPRFSFLCTIVTRTHLHRLILCRLNHGPTSCSSTLLPSTSPHSSILHRSTSQQTTLRPSPLSPVRLVPAMIRSVSPIDSTTWPRLGKNGERKDTNFERMGTQSRN